MTTDQSKFTRRAAVTTGLASVAALTALGKKSRSAANGKQDSSMSDRLPAVYVPHGGGPFSYVEMGLPGSEVDALVRYWKEVGAPSGPKPKALLVISAHWEENAPTVMTSPRPPMLYDYYGFPPASYQIQWPAPGDPALAARIGNLLRDRGFTTATDPERGFDHGTFVPLGRSFPNADVPTVQLSLKKSLDPAEHLAIGEALAPLRDEGIYIIGSGMSYHNMRGFRSSNANADAKRFDDWLQAVVQKPREDRNADLIRWQEAPAARAVHPREEHLLPLMVIAGAAGDDQGRVPWTGPVFGKTVSAVQFG